MVFHLLEKQLLELIYKKGVLKNVAKLTRKHLCKGFFFNKVADLMVCSFIREEALEQVFYCEFCKIFKNTYFRRTPPMTASFWLEYQNCFYITFVFLSRLCFPNQKCFNAQKMKFSIKDFFSKEVE